MRTIITLAFALLVGSLSAQVSENKILHSGDGITLMEFRIQEGTMNTVIYAAIIDPSSKKVKVEGITKTNSDGCTATDIAKKKGASVILGSGFVSSFYPLIPAGFLKIEDKIISPLRPNGYNGIAGVKNGVLKLLSIRSDAVKSLNEGFQTGPFLVRDGVVVYNRESKAAKARYNRAFIGINKSGKIVAAITTKPVSLIELSDFLSSTGIKELKCSDVLNFSGGGSETLVVKTKEKLFTYGNFGDNQSALLAFY